MKWAELEEWIKRMKINGQKASNKQIISLQSMSENYFN